MARRLSLLARDAHAGRLGLTSLLLSTTCNLLGAGFFSAEDTARAYSIYLSGQCKKTA